MENTNRKFDDYKSLQEKFCKTRNFELHCCQNCKHPACSNTGSNCKDYCGNYKSGR